MNNDIKITPIGSRVSTWGEGPIYWKDNLFYVDIEGHALVRLNPRTGDEQVWEMGERIGTAVPCQSGGFLCAGDSGIYLFDPINEEKKNLADPEADKRPDNRFNDGKCDPSGRFWAGTISTVKKIGDANLYMLDTKGQLSLKVDGVTNSNGICWNEEATVMYYIDTPTKKVMAYCYENDNGFLSQPSLVADTGVLALEGSPDGMTIDAEGMLWIAMCHGGLVVRINPDSGKLIQQVELPCVETTACAFGGDNLGRLFVTTGVHKSLDEKNAGKVFAIDGLAVRGVPAFAFEGAL